MTESRSRAGKWNRHLISDCFYGFIIGLISISVSEAKVTTPNTLKTYMPYNEVVDPAKIITISDMDLSYALATTLVRWDANKQITSGLAESWEVKAKGLKLVLKSGLKWSNGMKLTAAEVVTSLRRGVEVHPKDLRSFSALVENLEALSDEILVIRTKDAPSSQALLEKLTEPNYGILRILAGSGIDLSVSSGPFFLESRAPNSLMLAKNPNWAFANPGIAARVEIRRAGKDLDSQTVLSTNSWPNFIETSSLLNADLLKDYEKKGFEVWKRPLDKVFLARLGKRLENQDGYALLRFLGQKLSRTTLTEHLSGFTLGNQLFPKGYQLYDPEFNSETASAQLPARFRTTPLAVMVSRARVSADLQKNIGKAIEAAVGISPRFIEIDMSDYVRFRSEGNFDLYFGTLGLADPDPEGVMSYYFDNDPPVVPSADGSLLRKLDGARKVVDRNARISEFRKILSAAVNGGYVLPLFHLSTIGIGREYLDFKSVPASEESLTLSKIRFKGRK